MDTAFAPEDIAFRDEVRAFFAQAYDEELRRRLTSLQYRVTRQSGTEPPFQNAYWDNHEDGIYVDVVSGEERHLKVLEIARAVAFFVTEASSFVSGQVLRVDGGQLMA